MCLISVQKQKLMDFDEVEVGIWFAVPQIKSVHVSQYGFFLLISFSSSAEFFPPTDGSEFSWKRQLMARW